MFVKIYLVGGAVRDRLLGLPVKERDWVVVGGTPAEMRRRGFLSVGKSFPVFLHPHTKEEYALARTERKIGEGYYGFECHASPEVTLEEDLARRDLTINAMAETEDGEIVDPFGGVRDLESQILRHVSPAFVEDPVRVLRVARFAARFAPLGFGVAKETLALMQEIAQTSELDHLVPERIWKELVRALREPCPVAFIQTLRAAHALRKILPAIDVLFEVPLERSVSKKSVGEHTERVLIEATRLTIDPMVRFSALVHAVGAGQEASERIAQVKQIGSQLRIPREYQALAIIAVTKREECHRLVASHTEALLTFLEQCDAFRQPKRLEQLLLVCEADYKARKGVLEQYEPKRLVEKGWQAAQAVRLPQETLSKEGEAIKQQVREARLHAIEQAFSEERGEYK